MGSREFLKKSRKAPLVFAVPPVSSCGALWICFIVCPTFGSLGYFGTEPKIISRQLHTSALQFLWPGFVGWLASGTAASKTHFGVWPPELDLASLCRVSSLNNMHVAVVVIRGVRAIKLECSHLFAFSRHSRPPCCEEQCTTTWLVVCCPSACGWRLITPEAGRACVVAVGRSVHLF